MHLRGLTFYAPLAAALYTPSSGVLAGAGAEFAAGALLQPIKPCGDEWYNPNEYICHDGSLCPVINGEPLSRCGRACFSRYMYTCTNGTDLQLLPTLTRGRFSLRAANPQDSSIRPPAAPLPPPYGSTKPPPPIDGQPMTACRLTWNVGGITCSYCPTPPANPAVCPAGNTTALLAGDNAMDVVVPGGQAFFLTAGWTVGYTQAHSATQPPGSTTAGFRAFAEGGGFFNLLDGAWGWAACGRGEQRVLHVRNSTNVEELRGCAGLNLRVEQKAGEEDEPAAWQYS